MSRDLCSYLPRFAWDVLAAHHADTRALELYIDDDGTPVQSAESIGRWVGDVCLRAPSPSIPDIIEAVAQTAAHFARIPRRGGS